MSKVSICVLLYGPHTDLAERCLNSLEHASRDGRYVADFRIGMNKVAPLTGHFAATWARKQDKPVTIYATDENTYKYPMMRKMLYHPTAPPLADLTMWFDDDSYLTNEFSLENLVESVMPECHMAGQRWYLSPQGRQWEWIKTQTWFDSRFFKPRHFEFCQGGWWCSHTLMLTEYDWPTEELRHNGGDSLLGELCRHQGLVMAQYDKGVRINADSEGNHSKAERRGYSEGVLGKDFSGVAYDDRHQDFKFSVNKIVPRRVHIKLPRLT